MIRATALLLLFGSALQAQTTVQGAPLEQAISRCSGIESRLNRLDCYDAIPRDFSIASATPGAWVLDTRPDASGGQPIVALTLQALSGTSGFGEPVQLIARCRANTTELFIHWHEYLGADGSDGTDPIKNVTITLDDGTPETSPWPVSDDVEGTFTPAWAGNLLRRLATAERLTASVLPYDERQITATFDLRGLDTAITPLTAACNWQL